jgi:DNA-binding transcriptional LysR family regulator
MIELRSLRHVVVLARTLSFSRGAEELGISQPALTRSIQAIERQLEMRLFDRDRGGVALTPAGRRFAERALQLISDAEAFERDMLLTARGQGGRVRFGVAPLPARALLSGALANRLQAAPDLGNDVVVRNAEALWPLLAAGELEFFVAGDGQLPEDLPVRTEVLGYFPVSLIVRDGHPLLSGREAGATCPILMSSRHGEASTLLVSLRTRVRGVIHVIEDFNALAALVKSTDAVWITTPYGVIDELRAGSLRELDSNGHPERREYRIIAYGLERRAQSPAAARFKTSLREQMLRLKLAYEELCAARL